MGTNGHKYVPAVSEVILESIKRMNINAQFRRLPPLLLTIMIEDDRLDGCDLTNPVPRIWPPLRLYEREQAAFCTRMEALAAQNEKPNDWMNALLETVNGFYTVSWFPNCIYDLPLIITREPLIFQDVIRR